ncbi:MAG: flagellar basal body P-ring protein FlgI [Phycisphaerae bacterium]|nr:flagellar basal body P-ring protein FlgI [Phycisphaerae bacterium]
MKWRSAVSRGLALGLAAGVAGLAAMLAACESSEPVKAKEVRPTIVRDVPDLLRETIGAQTTFAGVDPTLVSGYGLVVGLRGTGGQNLPDRIAATMERQMGLNGIGRGAELKGTPLDGKSPREVLRDPNVAVVLVTASIPPGAPQGSTFDVFVQSVNASSLEGGTLWTTELRLGLANTFGQVQPQKLSEAHGPIFVNPFIDPAKMTRTSGRILNGGLVTSPFKVEIRLDNDSHAVARSMVSSINSRFPEGPGDREPTAIGRTGSSIAVRVPAAYRDKPEEFLDLLRAVRVDDRTPVEEIARRYVEGFKSQPGLSNEFSLCMEALGPKSLPFLRDLYDYAEIGPQFGALRAGAKLGDARAAVFLRKLSKEGNPALRPRAIALLAELDAGPTVDVALRDIITESDDLLVRVAAYEGLAKRAEAAQLARFMQQLRGREDNLAEQLPFAYLEARSQLVLPGGGLQGLSRLPIRTRSGRVKYFVDVVPFGRPMIYVTQARVPRIVVFGETAELRRPVFASAWSDRFMLDGGGTGEPIKLYYLDERTGEATKGTVEASLSLLTEYLGRETTASDPRAGLGMTYSEVVGTLYSIHKSGVTGAAFATEQDRLMSELLSAQQASRVKDRPETPDDVPELTVFDTGSVRPTGLDELPDVKPTITPIAPAKKDSGE